MESESEKKGIVACKSRFWKVFNFILPSLSAHVDISGSWVGWLVVDTTSLLIQQRKLLESQIFQLEFRFQC